MFRPKPNTTSNLVKLKNGTEVSEVTISKTIDALISMEYNAVALYELLEKCKNPDHKMFGNSQEIAEQKGLMLNGLIHQDVKNVILSAVESNEPLCFEINSPVAGSSVSYRK